MSFTSTHRTPNVPNSRRSHDVLSRYTSALVALCLSLFFSSRVGAQGEFPDYYVSSTVTIDVEPGAAARSEWQLVAEKDASGQWITSDGAWRPAGHMETNLPPGSYTVVFRPALGFDAPAELQVDLAGGGEVVRTVRFHELPRYLVGEIPPQDVRHGDTLRFIVEGALGGFEMEPHPMVERVGRLEGNVFSYTPSTEERVAFKVRFALRSGIEQEVVITPSAATTPEQTVIEYEGDVPDPEAKTYLKVVEENLGSERFNYRDRNVRKVVISGATVVFEDGHANDLYSLYASPVDDVKELEIYADTVVFRSPTQFPGTKVSVFARQLRFEDTGVEPASLSTLPVEETRDSASNKDGLHGLAGGDVTLHVAGMIARGSAPRLILRGGRGQNPYLGGNGGSWPALATYAKPDNHSSGWPSGSVTYVKQKSTCGPLDSRTDDWGTTACPKHGQNAKPARKPGNGGTAGTLRVPFDLPEDLYDLAGGRPGRPGPARTGGAPQYPAVAKHVSRTCALTYWVLRFVCEGISSCNKWEVTKTCRTAKKGADSPSTSGTAGPGTHLEATDLEATWVHPIVVRGVIQYAKDLYLNGHIDVVSDLLRSYDTAVAAVAADEATSTEVVQLGQEVNALRYRAASHLDYFGNPAGWVPMLSFEITRELFEQEVVAAGNLLYLTHYLGGEINDVTNRQGALSRLRAELLEEISAFEDELVQRRYEIEDLQDEAAAIDGEIRDRGSDLRARADSLREQAKKNVALKKALRVTGTVLTMVPVGQPALGLAGVGLNSASKFNEEEPIDTAINGTNAAHEFLQAQMAQDVQDFETVSGAGDPRVGAAMVARQKSIQGMDAGIVGVNMVLQEAKSWDSDVDAEVSLLASEDPRSKDLVAKIRQLNVRKQRFVEKMAVAVQRARFLMTSINQDYLALDSLQRDLVAVSGRIDQDAFSYIKEMERRAKDRLLKYQYYLAKAFEYRTVRPYVGNFQLERMYDFFADNFTNSISETPGDSILDPQSLIALYDEELRTITDAIVEDLVKRPQEQTLPIFYTLSEAELEQLNTPPYTLNLNLVEIGAVFSRTQENLRVSELLVESVVAAPRSGKNKANLSILVQHSGVSLLASEGETYKFNHYSSVEAPPITWEANFSPFTGDLTNSAPSKASASLLESLIGDTQDLLLYSRPSAWADLVVTKETLSDNVDMVLDELTLRVSVDFARKLRDQADLELKAMTEVGEPLMARVTLGRSDQNGRDDGRGEFRRVFRAGERVELEASTYHGSYRFDHWEDRTGQVLGTRPVLSMAMESSFNGAATLSKVRAVYVQGDSIETGGNPRFQRGDANADGNLDLSDAITVLGSLFGGGGELSCEKAGDTNDDGQVNISDPVTLLNYLFAGVEAPPAPFGDCGVDATEDTLTCTSYAPCE